MGFFSLERVPFGVTFNQKLLFTAGILALSQFNFGFEGGAFGNIQAMDAFIRDYGVMGPKGKMIITPKWLSFFNGFSIVGFAVGVVVGNRLTDHFGRRFTVQFMCLWTIICTTILLTSRNSDQILAGRSLNYLYIGMELAVIPLYQAEITPLQARGAMVATYNTALIVGSLIMSLVCYGTSGLVSKTSYMLPMGLFYIVPTIVLVSTFWIPESPRWLVIRERHEDALEALRQLRKGKFSEEEIQKELVQIQSTCSVQKYKPSNTNFLVRWLQIWSSKHIKRTGIVLGTNFFLHGTGNAFATMYGTVFLKSLGTVNPFALSVISLLVVLVVSVATLVLVDTIGRRPFLLIGTAVQASALLIMGGLGLISPSTVPVKSGIVATMIIFSSGYTAAWGQLSHTITAELPSAEVRDMTYATGSLLAISTQAALTFGLPYLLNEPYAALGPKVGFIFGATASLGLIFAFFCVPECTGKSLEEVDILFNNKVPVRKFKSSKIFIRRDGDEKGNDIEVWIQTSESRESATLEGVANDRMLQEFK